MTPARKFPDEKSFGDNISLSVTIFVTYTCEMHFIFGEKRAHLNALYFLNALYVFVGFFIPVTP